MKKVIGYMLLGLLLIGSFVGFVIQYGFWGTVVAYIVAFSIIGIAMLAGHLIASED